MTYSNSHSMIYKASSIICTRQQQDQEKLMVSACGVSRLEGPWYGRGVGPGASNSFLSPLSAEACA